jgi:hypothetical protein
MKSSATVTSAEISSDPRQPRRFEKKKNMCRPPVLHIHGQPPVRTGQSPAGVHSTSSISRRRSYLLIGAEPGVRARQRLLEEIVRSRSAKLVRPNWHSACAPRPQHPTADRGSAARRRRWGFRRELVRSCPIKPRGSARVPRGNGEPRTKSHDGRLMLYVGRFSLFPRPRGPGPLQGSGDARWKDQEASIDGRQDLSPADEGGCIRSEPASHGRVQDGKKAGGMWTDGFGDHFFGSIAAASRAGSS